MAFEKIENADLSGKMISELADVPELTADELKKGLMQHRRMSSSLNSIS